MASVHTPRVGVATIAIYKIIKYIGKVCKELRRNFSAVSRVTGTV